jgi:hypothetical protein
VETLRTFAVFGAISFSILGVLRLGLYVALRTGQLSSERYERIVNAFTSSGRGRSGPGGGGPGGGGR